MFEIFHRYFLFLKQFLVQLSSIADIGSYKKWCLMSRELIVNILSEKEEGTARAARNQNTLLERQMMEGRRRKTLFVVSVLGSDPHF